MTYKIDNHTGRCLVVKRTKSGLGLVTLVRIEKGGFVAEYTGQILNKAQANKRGGKYLFETSVNRYIDGTGRQNLARYINHSCAPNCEVDIRRGRVMINARRNIRAGEELGYDYGKEYFDAYIKPHGCKCKKCE